MSNMYEKVRDRQKDIKEKVIEEFKRTPIIQIVCKRLGIARCTYYRWISEDITFRKSCADAQSESREMLNDVLESKLIQLANEGNIAGLIFYLKHNHPRYSETLIGLSPVDIEYVANYVLNYPNSDASDKLFLNILLEKRISIKVGKYLLSILRKLKSTDIEKSEEDKIRLLQQVINPK